MEIKFGDSESAVSACRSQSRTGGLQKLVSQKLAEMNQLYQPAIAVNYDAESASSVHNLPGERTLIMASNRGPVTIRQSESGDLEYRRGSGVNWLGAF